MVEHPPQHLDFDRKTSIHRITRRMVEFGISLRWSGNAFVELGFDGSSRFRDAPADSL